MIDVLIEPKWAQPVFSCLGRTGEKADWGNNRVTIGMKQPENWYVNPLGRHPFNIITEEIYND